MSGVEAKGDGAKPGGAETTPTGFARFFVSRCRPQGVGGPVTARIAARSLLASCPAPRRCRRRRLVLTGRTRLRHPFPAPQSKKKSVKMKLGDKLSMYYNEEVRGWRFGAAACQRPPACNGSGGCGGGWQLYAATTADLSVTLIEPHYTEICCSSSAG